MKTNRLLILLLIVLTIVLGSCEMFINWFGTTIDGRVDAFDKEINRGDVSQYYKHFHDDTQEKSLMKDDPNNFPWNILDDNNADIITYNVSGETVTGSMDSDGDPFDFTMQMKKDGLDYYIRSLVIGGSYDIRKLQ